MNEKIVFLDRDGVINKLIERDGRKVSPRVFDDFQILPGVSEAINNLRGSGFKIVVVSNQPDISRGLMDTAELELMHQLVYSLGVETIRYCPHTDEDNCICRKPRPGLMIEQIRASRTPPIEIWMIGDNLSDVFAGQAVGAKTVLICSDLESHGANADLIANDLLEAANFILKTTKK